MHSHAFPRFSAFPWRCAKVSQQWRVTTHVKYCQPEKLIQMLAFRIFTWGHNVDMLEKAMAPHSSTLAWKIPWTVEPGRLQSMGSLRAGHNWATSLSLFTFHFHALEKEMATHSTVLAWRISGMAEPGGLPSMGSHRVRHDWSNLAAAAARRHVMPYKAECYKGSGIISQGSTQGLVLKTVFFLECAGF